MKKNKIVIWIITITISLILIDQTSKMVVKQNFTEPIEKGIFGIHLIENTGMAFGFNHGNTKNIILTSLILLIIIHFIRNQKDRIDEPTAVAISMILAGGISNLIDRILRGGVVDFISIRNFAIVNIADCYIVIGWVLLIIFLIQFNQKIGEIKDCEKQ